MSLCIVLYSLFHLFCSCVVFVAGEYRTVKWLNLKEALTPLMRKILDQLPPNDPGLIYRCLTRFVLCINHFHIICFVSHYAHFVYEAKLFTNYPPASEAGLRLHMRGSPQTSSCIGFAMDFCSMFNFIYYFFGYSFSLGGGLQAWEFFGECWLMVHGYRKGKRNLVNE